MRCKAKMIHWLWIEAYGRVKYWGIVVEGRDRPRLVVFANDLPASWHAQCAPLNLTVYASPAPGK